MRTIAKPAALYARMAVDIELDGDEFLARLADLATDTEGRGFQTRVLRAPSICRGTGDVLWAGFLGAEVEFQFEPIGESRTSFVQAATGIDFGRVDFVDGRVQASWYECPGTVFYTMFRDAEGRHFILADDAKPFLAWSVVSP